MKDQSSQRSSSTKVRIQYPECGSTDVVKDPATAWDEEAQEWSLVCVYDSTTCQTCEYERDYRFKHVPITSISDQPPV